MPLSSAVRILVIFLLLLLTFAGPVASVTSVATLAPGPGFWEGLLHGFLSLLKLMARPFVDVAIVDAGNRLFSYDIGFYVGVLLFAGVGAAAAASSPDTDQLETEIPRAAAAAVRTCRDAADPDPITRTSWRADASLSSVSSDRVLTGE